MLREARWLAPNVSQSAISPGILADFALVLRMHDSNTKTKAYPAAIHCNPFLDSPTGLRVGSEHHEKRPPKPFSADQCKHEYEQIKTLTTNASSNGRDHARN
jgi:hypothetical protein